MSHSEHEVLLKSHDEGKLSLQGLVLILLATTVTGGTVGVPRAFALAGWGVGIAVFTASAALSCLSLHCLFRCASLERGSGKSMSYLTLVDQKLPAWLAKLVGVSIIALFFGCVGMTLLLATHVLSGLAIEYGDPFVGANFISVVLLFTVLPICLTRSFSALQFVSIASFTAQVMVVVAVCVMCREHQQHSVAGVEMVTDVVPVTTPCGILAALPIALFVFFCQVSAPQLFMELQPQVREYSSLAGFVAVALALVTYAVLGLLGYAAFGSATKGDILQTIAADGGSGWLLDFSRGLLGIVLLCTVPLQVLPLRTTLMSSFMATSPDLSFAHHTAITAAILAFALSIARACPWLDVLMGILGASAVTLLCLVVPGLLTLRCCDGGADKAKGLLLTASGMFCAPLALAAILVQHWPRQMPAWL